MKLKDILLPTSLLIMILLFIFTIVTCSHDKNIETNHYEDIINTTISNHDTIILLQPEFLMSNSPKEDLMEVLYHYNVSYPEIMYAQAVLETGNFRSRICREYNNLFGLYNSSAHDYYKFDHWTESVIGYLDYIQYRYDSTYIDYYDFLSTIGYAEDPNYINKLKRIVSQYD